MNTKKANKYLYTRIIQYICPNSPYGWEDVEWPENAADERYLLREYRLGGHSVRCIIRREPNPDYNEVT